MVSAPSSRLAYIDWLRGLACVLMFQTHCYDAWLGGAARNSRFAVWSQLGGTFPAPLFLFLAGLSLAIVTEKLLNKGFSPAAIAKTVIKRGAQILALGLLFRVQEFAVSLGWAPWSDLFRVDILNTIGLSIILMGVVCSTAIANARAARRRTQLMAGAALAAAAIAALTPLIWTTWQPAFLPWPLESYIDGVHNLGRPQPGFFPVFPWTAFAFAGLAFGFLLMSRPAQRLGSRGFLLLGPGGLMLIWLGKFLDSRPVSVYPVYDFWHTSPNFFLIRIGFLLLFMAVAYSWCRWGLGRWGFSPLIQLGNTSLLVYWVHIELVYGRFSILPRRSQSVKGATVGLLAISLAMLALSLVRTRGIPRIRQWLAWGDTSTGAATRA
ncbi:MAG: DUF1624 domain-containing protein [Acidobacteria bacterium]|nr:DUF1624 domain-containing protein [Acidobacteriota bacterium]